MLTIFLQNRGFKTLFKKITTIFYHFLFVLQKIVCIFIKLLKKETLIINNLKF